MPSCSLTHRRTTVVRFNRKLWSSHDGMRTIKVLDLLAHCSPNIRIFAWCFLAPVVSSLIAGCNEVPALYRHMTIQDLRGSRPDSTFRDLRNRYAKSPKAKVANAARGAGISSSRDPLSCCSSFGPVCRVLPIVLRTPYCPWLTTTQLSEAYSFLKSTSYPICTAHSC